MRRPPITAFLTAGACALSLAAPAAAQEAAAPRYLAWPGKAARPVATSAVEAPVGSAPADISIETRGGYAPAPMRVSATPRRRAPIIPHGGFSAQPRQNLTPASAWLGPNAPTYQPVPPPPQPYAYPAAAEPARASEPTPWSPAPAAQPTAYIAAAAPPPPAPLPPRDAPRVAPTSAPTWNPAPAPQPTYVQPAPVAAPSAAPMVEASTPPAPAATATDASVVDPMAPRPDALIFRLQRPAPQPAPVVPQAQQTEAAPSPDGQQAPPQGGARYYSVHRQAGRQPDATPLPPPVYLDALPVELITPPSSTDLAEPPAAPNLIRNSNGRLQAAPDTEVQDQP